MITLTRDAWKKFAPKCPVAWTEALFSNLDFLQEKGILESELRWCHFAATVLWEANGFKELRENLNYKTIGALKRAWPSRFGHLSDAQCRVYLRNPVGLGNKVYNGRMGNRIGSNDGYDFRGGGWIQTTGRAAVEAYCKPLGIEATSTTLDDPVLTLKFAGLEWEQSKCNEWADANDIRKVAKAINTGSADSNVQPNGMSGRIDAFAKAWQLWGEYGVADSAPKVPTIKEIVAKVGTPAALAGPAISALSSPAGEPAKQTAQSFMPSVSDLDKIVSTGQRVRSLTDQAGDLGSWLMHSAATPWAMLVILIGIYFIWRSSGAGTSRSTVNDSSN